MADRLAATCLARPAGWLTGWLVRCGSQLLWLAMAGWLAACRCWLAGLLASWLVQILQFGWLAGGLLLLCLWLKRLLMFLTLAGGRRKRGNWAGGGGENILYFICFCDPSLQSPVYATKNKNRLGEKSGGGDPHPIISDWRPKLQTIIRPI